MFQGQSPYLPQEREQVFTKASQVIVVILHNSKASVQGRNSFRMQNNNQFLGGWGKHSGTIEQMNS